MNKYKKYTKYAKYIIVWIIGIMAIDILLFAPVIYFAKLDIFNPSLSFIAGTLGILSIWSIFIFSRIFKKKEEEDGKKEI